MLVRWRVKCVLCGKKGSTVNHDGQPPKHKGAMPGACPANPSGGNFGHKPIWVKD